MTDCASLVVLNSHSGMQFAAPYLFHMFMYIALNCRNAHKTCPSLDSHGRLASFDQTSRDFEDVFQSSDYLPGSICGHDRDSEPANQTLIYKPGLLGVEVTGIDLKKPVPEDVVNRIKQDLFKHRLLIFKNQGKVPAHRHAEISRWFGEPSMYHQDRGPHEKTPHPAVLRLSNDPAEGRGGVGYEGWHTDGHWLEKPIAVGSYHLVAVPRSGYTGFVGVRELVDSVSQKTRNKWNRLWRLSANSIAHPLLFTHPVTKDLAMNVHTSPKYTGGFVYDMDTPQPWRVSDEEKVKILQEIEQEVTKDDERLVYRHKWEDGDFIISDNYGVLHFASAETQRPREEVGLRILHRVSALGTSVPSK